jgi:hypothetical protein
MKILALILAAIMAASPAYAVSRVSPLSMTCNQARAAWPAVHNQGAVIARLTSRRGLPIYDRYARNSHYCDASKYAEWKNIPTRDDRTCPVLNCQNIDNLDGQFIVPTHSL